MPDHPSLASASHTGAGAQAGHRPAWPHSVGVRPQHDAVDAGGVSSVQVASGRSGAGSVDAGTADSHQRQTLAASTVAPSTAGRLPSLIPAQAGPSTREQVLPAQAGSTHQRHQTGDTLQPPQGFAEVVSREQMPAALELLHADPVTNVAILSWLQAAANDPSRLGAQLWGYRQQPDYASHPNQTGAPQQPAPHQPSQPWEALCYAGANLVPTHAHPHHLQAFAQVAKRWGKRCSSIVGPAASVAPLWEMLEPHWGAARQLRPRQPIMVLDQPVQVRPDSRVRMVAPSELEVLMPAAIAMFTEEVGVSPVAGPGRFAAYQARIAELIAHGQAFAWIENDEVLFKAEVGALTDQVAQVQGVWLTPRLRGQGLAAAAMAAVAELTQVFLAPTVSLYVNDFNAPARAIYTKVGFHDIGTAMTVML